MISLSSPAFAQNMAMQDLQDLPSAKAPVIDTNKVLSKDSWAYKTLESISKKYDAENSNEKFNPSKPLTRNEAAYILVSLMGKIEDNKVQITDYEKGKLEGVQQELQQELTTLKGRVDKVETSVSTLQGSVSNLETGDSKNIKMDFGDKFKINGGFQFKYLGNMRKGIDSTTSTNPSGFSIPMSDFIFNGTLVPHLRYVMEIQPQRLLNSGSEYSSSTIPYSTKGLLADAYVSTDIIKNNTFYLGQTRVPIGQEGAQSPFTLDMINKAQIARNFGDFRAPGIKFAGNYPFIDYYGGIYNGDHDNGVDTVSRQALYAGWIVLKPLFQHPELGKLELGGGYDYGQGNYTTIASPFRQRTTGFYGGYTYKKYSIKGEFALADGYLAVDQKSNGWYINNSYFLTKKLQLEARMDAFNPNQAAHHDWITEYTVGSNYYFLNQNLKLMLDLAYVSNQAASNSQRIMAQTQYQF